MAQVNLTLTPATTSQAGIMSAALATIIDTLNYGLNNGDGYYYDYTAERTPTNFIIDLAYVTASGTGGNASVTVPLATTEYAGLLSPAFRDQLTSVNTSDPLINPQPQGLVYAVNAEATANASILTYYYSDAAGTLNNASFSINSVTSAAAGLVPASWYSTLNGLTNPDNLGSELVIDDFVIVSNPDGSPRIAKISVPDTASRLVSQAPTVTTAPSNSYILLFNLDEEIALKISIADLKSLMDTL